jgi:hypothetical protein
VVAPRMLSLRSSLGGQGLGRPSAPFGAWSEQRQPAAPPASLRSGGGGRTGQGPSLRAQLGVALGGPRAQLRAAGGAVAVAAATAVMPPSDPAVVAAVAARVHFGALERLHAARHKDALRLSRSLLAGSPGDIGDAGALRGKEEPAEAVEECGTSPPEVEGRQKREVKRGNGRTYTDVAGVVAVARMQSCEKSGGQSVRISAHGGWSASTASARRQRPGVQRPLRVPRSMQQPRHCYRYTTGAEWG